MKNNFLRIWQIPILLGILTMFGLLAALLGSGVWNWLSWLALAIPLWVGAKYLFVGKGK